MTGRAEEPFWMVYGEGQRAPTCEHPNQASAEAEARRLAQAAPGVRFVVLEARVGFRRLPPSLPPLERTDFVEVPF